MAVNAAPAGAMARAAMVASGWRQISAVADAMARLM